MRITVSDVCTPGRSVPGTSGTCTREPLASTIRGAVIRSPESVSSTRGSTKCTYSWMTVTFSSERR